MNYLVSQYRIFGASESQSQNLRAFSGIGGVNAICSNLGNRAYLAKCECVVCLECRNA
jgi:hypothetical protein